MNHPKQTQFKELQKMGFKIIRNAGIVASIRRRSKNDFWSNYGCLEIVIHPKKARESLFWTKIRKGQKIKPGQKVVIYTLNNRPASAFRHHLNVVGIDADGEVIYRWKKNEPLYCYDGC